MSDRVILDQFEWHALSPRRAWMFTPTPFEDSGRATLARVGESAS